MPRYELYDDKPQEPPIRLRLVESAKGRVLLRAYCGDRYANLIAFDGGRPKRFGAASDVPGLETDEQGRILID